MATSKTNTPAAAPAYEPETHYDVRLARPVQWNGVTLLPSAETRLKGKVCAEIAADIIEATAVPAPAA